MESLIDYNIIRKRIYDCVVDKIRRGENPELYQEIVNNLETAVIAIFHHLENTERIEFNYNHLPPTKHLKKILKPIYHILIILNNGKFASIINIPNIELTFRDHDVLFHNIKSTTPINEKISCLKELYHNNNFKIDNIYHTIERFQQLSIEQLKIDVSYHNLLKKKKMRKIKKDVTINSENRFIIRFGADRYLVES